MEGMGVKDGVKFGADSRMAIYHELQESVPIGDGIGHVARKLAVIFDDSGTFMEHIEKIGVG